jgi:hypothetical protein
VLQARQDRRSVVTDAQARYFGAVLGERPLVPLGAARYGALRLRDWMAQAAAHSR